jgi:hypothetical protein
MTEVDVADAVDAEFVVELFCNPFMIPRNFVEAWGLQELIIKKYKRIINRLERKFIFLSFNFRNRISVFPEY